MITTRSVLAKAALVALPLALTLGAPAAAFASAPAAPTTSTRTATADAGAGHSVPGIGARTGETSRCTRATGWECFKSSPPPAGTVGVPYAYQIVVDSTQIDPGATLSITRALPDGLTFDPASKMITGTPTTAGRANFTIVATDAAGTVNAPTSIAIAPATVTIDCPSTVDTRVDRAVYFVCGSNATPGSGTWSVETTVGSLPPGLTLSPEGSVYGVPQVAGGYSVLLRFTTSASSVTTLVNFNVGSSVRGRY